MFPPYVRRCKFGDRKTKLTTATTILYRNTISSFFFVDPDNQGCVQFTSNFSYFSFSPVKFLRIASAANPNPHHPQPPRHTHDQSKMVQETVAALLSNKSHHHHHRHHPQNRVTSIPDELYNLTQLAEVASKLSTTNLQQIGSYLRRQDDSEDDDGIVIEDRSKHDTNTSDSNDSFRVHKLKSYWSKHERPVSLSSRPRYNGSSSSSSPHSRSSFVSVSEEDEDKASMYKYSHKIFDRKKARPKLLPLADQIERDEGESNVRDVGLIKSEDNLSPEDIHTCPECDKKYSTSSNLARHRQTHRYYTSLEILLLMNSG